MTEELTTLEFDRDEINLIIGALLEKEMNREHYSAGYDPTRGPSAADLCCDYHKYEYQSRKENYEHLLEYQNYIKKVRHRFEEVYDKD